MEIKPDKKLYPVSEIKETKAINVTSEHLLNNILNELKEIRKLLERR